MTPQDRLKEIEAQHLKWAYQFVAQEENTEWLIARIKQLEKAAMFPNERLPTSAINTQAELADTLDFLVAWIKITLNALTTMPEDKE